MRHKTFGGRAARWGSLEHPPDTIVELTKCGPRGKRWGGRRVRWNEKKIKKRRRKENLGKMVKIKEQRIVERVGRKRRQEKTERGKGKIEPDLYSTRCFIKKTPFVFSHSLK